MNNGLLNVPQPANELVKEYRVGSVERIALKEALKQAKSETRELPMWINGQSVFTEKK